MRSSSNFKNFEVVFLLKKISRSSSIFLQVKIRLHTENKLPRLPRTALFVMSPGGGMVVVWLFLTDNNTTLTKLF